ncbi:hypothetical protein Ga0074812_11698 [Parafrankia irregularis]|uniref:Uncharacterized protein n=1 Tax=Parafrankia irregularis TaxID=795642 RepID=A0A0S4QRZ2_9ACTN|nr:MULTISPECIES: hypothetical protein [Parafrankia]MBE3199912.1 hypothetical protein [Parafrankia sp. CH37]CUU58068.1 hypothetical protein Ga0074812_11698 [Parafrankia irregularis]
MLVREIALVPYDPDGESGENVEFDNLRHHQVMEVTAALQKQVTRDFAPIWGVSATVDAFAKLSDVPLGYWPVLLVEDVRGAAGVHLDEDGQPFSLVEVGSSWSLTASHEVLEMLADPFGNRLVAGQSPVASQGRVQFLVEIADPSEDIRWSYTVNDIVVSDFYTSRYFDPVAASGVQYSFTGAITEPRQVREGGYLSWHNPDDDHWYQHTFFGPKLELRDLGKFTRDGRSIREAIDANTRREYAEIQRQSNLDSGTPRLQEAVTTKQSSDQISAKRAKFLDEYISRKLMER